MFITSPLHQIPPPQFCHDVHHRAIYQKHIRTSGTPLALSVAADLNESTPAGTSSVLLHHSSPSPARLQTESRASRTSRKRGTRGLHCARYEMMLSSDKGTDGEEVADEDVAEDAGVTDDSVEEGGVEA